ncbi:MAG: UDP-N-acetylmuramate:L-alanyl-gamma-D-glutamyl-meso-diaminopimelate ligase [Legionellales bacterium RIFCSPHIGHO2_12_FULL_35_11]|nr:MAG: UDP-N-acetylmuramate:L-alanyl-gamma-D-glutamyl-meso-diaminopimelate ligase [Legionellales bacterium RIFCSPHIGHO2_12_FULL_35_11]
MHLHILGISGTFMSALAMLAKDLGHEVTGSDAACYPPISDLLYEKGISWTEGYENTIDALRSDCVIVGNAIKRGMPVMEDVLNAGKKYISGPQWLAENILGKYKVIAISGTHGKTTTTSMISYILEFAGLNPGFLIGGVASNFRTSSRLGIGEWFVIEADEYDTAFFDKRPKFIHYHPKVAILNNLEFDHADIYPDLASIKLQFHYLLRTIPSKGLVIKPKSSVALNDVLKMGSYCNTEEVSLTSNANWQAKLKIPSASSFEVYHCNQLVAQVNWNLIGDFNVENALAAIAASFYAGVSPEISARALEEFIPVKRRLEVKASAHDITVYDDFAHHPTAISKTIQALKKSKRHQRIIAVIEFSSYTMRTGVHVNELKHALDGIDEAYLLNPQDFAHNLFTSEWKFPYSVLNSTDEIVSQVTSRVLPNDAVLVMSNRGFDNIHKKLAESIDRRFSLGAVQQ